MIGSVSCFVLKSFSDETQFGMLIMNVVTCPFCCFFVLLNVAFVLLIFQCSLSLFSVFLSLSFYCLQRRHLSVISYYFVPLFIGLGGAVAK